LLLDLKQGGEIGEIDIRIMQILFSQVSNILRGEMAELLLGFSQRTAAFLTFSVHVMHFCNLFRVCSIESVSVRASMTAFLQAPERTFVSSSFGQILVCLG
jgi:hypothetical protein